MATEESREIYLHSADITDEILSSLSSIAPNICIVRIASASLKPKSLKSVHICISIDEAKRIEGLFLAFSKLKNSHDKLNKRIKTVKENSTTLAKEKAALLADNEELSTRVEELQEIIKIHEDYNERLETNNQQLLKNKNDFKLNALDEKFIASPAAGIAKLAETGAIGRPLPGGLPGLGKKR